MLAPSDLVFPDDPDFDNDGILNEVDPFIRDASNGTSVVVTPGQSFLWDFDANQDNNLPGPDGYGGGLTGVMVDGTTNFEQFFQAPSTLPGQDINLDNVKFTTASGGGTTVIEFVSNGDPGATQNDGKFLFHTGATIPPNAGTATFTWSVLNPGDAFSGNFQQIGGYLGTGDQSDFLKIVAIQHGSGEIQFSLETSDVPTETFIQANDLFNVAEVDAKKIFFEVEVDIAAATATPTVTYETATGQTTVGGSSISLMGTNVLEAIKGNYTVQGLSSGVAVGLFSSNTGQLPVDTFQAIFDSVEITTTELQLPPQAQDDEQSTGVNNVLPIPVGDLLANDSDPNPGDTLSVSAVFNAVNGTAVLNDNGTPSITTDDFVTFTPTQNFEGFASFDYSITDGTSSDTAMVTIAVADELVIYRVNAGGTEVPASVSDPLSNLPWAANAGAGAQSGTGFSVNTGFTGTLSIANQNDPNARHASLPDYVPYDVFATERWDPSDAPEMQWNFDVTPGGTYAVRLLVRNGFGGTSGPGQRVFDIEIEGVEYFSSVDLSNEYGHQVAAMLEQTITATDNSLDIQFLHDVENPLINAIEISQVGNPPLPTVSVVSGNQTVHEGLAGSQVQISILSSEIVPANETVTVNFEVTEGSATAQLDYDVPGATLNAGTYTGSVQIAGSSSDVTVLIDILSDMDVELDEDFTFTITSVSANATVGTSSATVTIVDGAVDSFNSVPTPSDDFSNDRLNPTDVTLQLGANTLIAAHDAADLDYVTVEVQVGHELIAANLTDYIGGANLTFLGLHAGETFPDENTLVNGGPDLSTLLDGGTLYGNALVGTNILDELTSMVIEGDGRIVAGLNNPLGAGLYTFWFSQNGGPTQSILELVTAEVGVGFAELAITVNFDNVQISNFIDNSFQITNTGDKGIQQVVIDVTDALFPDTVFDPFGEAGDLGGKLLTINNAGGTGVIAPDHGTSGAPGTSYIGAGGILGFEGIQLLFDENVLGGFNPGETIGFAIDMAANSIAGAEKSTLDGVQFPRGTSVACRVRNLSARRLRLRSSTEPLPRASCRVSTIKADRGARPLRTRQICRRR